MTIKSQIPNPKSHLPWLLLPLLLAAVFFVYQPIWHGGLLWDDDHHLTRAALQSVDGLWRIWTEPGATQQYYPVAHSAFWLEHRAWGDAVLGYHLVNIALHGTSAFLLFLILRSIGVPGAGVAAVVFALHPVNVESVAWISELKNALSTMFYLAAALVYRRFDESRGRGGARSAPTYVASFVLFILALASKTVTATLPGALLIVCWWRRGRLEWRRDIVPLIPFFVLGLAAGLATAWVERHFIGAKGAEFQLTIVERGLIAGRAVWFYLAKLSWPAGLVFEYPRWRINEREGWQYGYPIALAAAIIACWMVRGRTRAPLAILLLFCAALAPALGFFDVFPFRYSFVADHFQYLATIPIAAAAGAAATNLLRRLDAKPVTAGVVAALALGVPLAVAANLHARDFESAETLYRATIARNPDAWMAHGNLALILMARGEKRAAREQFMEALRIDPDAPETQMNAGRLLIDEGALSEGIDHLRTALRLSPDLADAHSNLGVALLRGNEPAEAIVEFERAVSIVPGHREATVNLAAVHQRLGVADAQASRLSEAIAHFEAAARYAPEDGGCRYNLGTAYLAAGRPRDAIPQLEEALRLNPGLASARANLVEAQRQIGAAGSGTLKP